MWFLRRLSKLGASQHTLIDIYDKMVRTLLEKSAPVFTGALSKTNIDDIEDIQRAAFRIIFKGQYKSYSNTLEIVGEKTLEDRRKSITLKFAKKCLKHPQMKHLFLKKGIGNKIRRGDMFVEPRFVTVRKYKSPVQFMTRLLNNNLK